jgi:hypothetical protein
MKNCNYCVILLQIVVLHQFYEGCCLKKCSPHFFEHKFPSIVHAVNLGAATAEDKVAVLENIRNITNYKLVIEEKLDGENIGISIDRNKNIRMKNKTHSYELNRDYPTMRNWVLQHEKELLSKLRPCRDIMYGEWLHVKFTIPYTNLSDWFIAFDIVDYTMQHFEGQNYMRKLLQNTSIQFSKPIYTGKLPSFEALVNMTNGPSEFGPESREGIIIRRYDQSDQLINVFKIVSNSSLAYTCCTYICL